ncbi:MFS transporter [Microbacterium betulae]|uniref:MFS transporter n=1 Tax=Microbacterium betulae TaxID=2981139 RepID=A0AA97FGH2_9MICO|nr:MFS transporter [Microbacterium sp. AB]WOF22233.1 MFS transporter [Microbacterium sp. AB]
MTQPIPTRRMWWIALIAGMASYIDAAAMTSSGTALVLLKDTLALTPETIGVLSSALTFSVALGALVGGRLGDLLGRKTVFLATMVMIALGAVLLVFVEVFPGLLAGMILVGLGAGADLPVSLATIAEMARAGLRGSMIGFSHLLWKIGSMVVLGLATIVGGMGQLGAQILFGHILVITVLTLVGRLSVPESARWRAERLAERADASSRSDAALGWSTLRTLLQPPFVTYFLALAVFYTLMNLGSNTVSQYGAYLYTEVADSTVQVYSTVKLITMFLGALLVLVFMKVVATRWRMAWFVAGAVCTVVAMCVPLAFGPQVWTLHVMMFLWLVGTVFAGEGIMKIWTQESFPTLLRSSAQGAIIAIARFGSAALALVTPIVLANGPRALFALLAGACLVAVVLAFAVFSRQRTTVIDEEAADDEAPFVPSSDEARARG